MMTAAVEKNHKEFEKKLYGISKIQRLINIQEQRKKLSIKKS